ncbi:MAG: hypothetical protein WBC16_01885, partial [Candidatus Omnitrophota bacterium]
SDRKGTCSHKMKEKVPIEKIRERVSLLIGVGEKLQAEFCRKFIGQEVEILVEKKIKDDMLIEGYTGEYVKVKLKGFSGKEGSLIRSKVNYVDEVLPFLLIGHKEPKEKATKR